MSYVENPLTEEIIELALREDIQSGDITTNNLISENKIATGSLTSKEEGIICGLELAEKIFQKFDSEFKLNCYLKDGDRTEKGKVIAEFSGKLRAILTAERTVLNFLQRMSGVATLTNKFVREIENTNTKLLDTRKTLPGHRVLDKYAVKCGGGTNHRIGLYDMVMVKDNHIKAAGSINKAVDKIKESVNEKIKIEVETSNLDEVHQALDAKADIIMLDNMNTKEMIEAVHLINKRAKSEASGNVNLSTIREIATTKVDFISVGAITHSVKALDISLNID